MLENSQVDLKIRCTVVLTRVKIVSDYRWSLRNWQVDLIYDCLQNLEIIILLAFYIFFSIWEPRKYFVYLKVIFCNFGVRFIFSSKNQNELIPNMSNLRFLGIFQSSRYFLEDSRNDGIFEFRFKNQVP